MLILRVQAFIHKVLNMNKMFGENVWLARWVWVLLLAFWLLDTCSVHSRTLDSSLRLGDDRLAIYKVSTSPHNLHVRQAARLLKFEVLSNTTNPTDVKAVTSVHDIASNNLTEQLRSPSANDDEKGLKGGLPYWVIPVIILGTTGTMILLVWMAVSCSVTMRFRWKSQNRSLRDYSHLPSTVKIAKKDITKCVVQQTIS